MAKARVILASASPRRRELLTNIGMVFDVVTPCVDESDLSGNPAEVARGLALSKAREVASRVRGPLVIGADTVVLVDGILLGKPYDSQDACRMLRMLSGKAHTVITGVAIIDTATGQALVEHEESTVYIRTLDEREILAYARTGEPMDKAGAYAVQGIGSVIVSRIEGCYFNVVGLPVSRLAQMLKQFGVHVLG